MTDLIFTFLIGIYQSFLTCLQLGIFVPCGLKYHILILVFCFSQSNRYFPNIKPLFLPQGDKNIHAKEIEGNSIAGCVTVGW